MVNNLVPQVAALIADRREAVAHTAAQELQLASPQELPALVHRLAGKLGVFGHEAAGEAAHRLLLDLRGGLGATEYPGRVSEIVSLLDPVAGGRP